MNLRLKALLLSFVLAHLPLATAQNFAPAVSYATQTFPFASAAADFNGDGKLDVVVGNDASNTLSLFLGNGDGTLNQPSTIQVGLSPIVIVTADFNQDGHVDIAVGGLSGTPTIQILFGNGDGTFQPPVDVTIPGLSGGLTNLLFSVSDMAAADVNGDKKPDLVVGTCNGAAILLNDGTGKFQFVGSVLGGHTIQNLTVADFNRDGIPDLALVTSLSLSASQAPSAFVAIGNGDGSFQAPVTLPFNIQNPDGIAVADINNDGLPDVIVSDNGISVTSNAGSVQTALQTASGTFVQGATLASSLAPTGIVAGDFDGDGNVDIAVTSGGVSSQQSEFLVFPGRGDGSFAAPTMFNVGADAAHPIAIHLTSTAALDAVTSNGVANTISVLVNHSADTLTLSSSLNPSPITQPVTFTATVHPTFPGTGSLSGSLIFADGTTTLGTASISSSGTGNLTSTFTTAGKHSVRAVFSGNANFVGGSSASLTQVVTQATPAVGVSSTSNPSTFGQTVSFTVTVSGVSNAPAPTGTVSILDGGTIVLSGTLDTSGKVALATSALATGGHGITAQYSGDENYTTASSSPLTQTVTKNSVVLGLTSAPNPSTFGQSVVFTVQASPAKPGGSLGTALPTGIVIFNDGSTVLAASALDSSGAATLATNALSVGAHAITVSYGGDANFSAASSSTYTQAVNKAATQIALTSSMNPTTNVATITLGAAVTSNAGIPSGNIAFFDGSRLLASLALDNSGRAALQLSKLSLGTHIFMANYNGNQFFAGSQATPLTETVVSPPPGDFTIALKQASATITAGETFSTQATLTPLNGLTGKAILSCIGAPRGSSCTISPTTAMFSGSGPVSASVVITSTASANMIGYSSTSGTRGLALLTLCLLPFGFACVLTPSLKQKRAAAIVAIVFAGVLTGCGGSSSASRTGPTSTPPGAYTVTIQAVDGKLAHSTELALTVQ